MINPASHNVRCGIDHKVICESLVFSELYDPSKAIS